MAKKCVSFMDVAGRVVVRDHCSRTPGPGAWHDMGGGGKRGRVEREANFKHCSTQRAFYFFLLEALGYLQPVPSRG